MLAAIQAPVIMMSQNRQDKKDRLRGELDFDVNRRAHTEIQGLARKLNLMGDRIGDIEDLLREKTIACSTTLWDYVIVGPCLCRERMSTMGYSWEA